jgi:hypothetical protein
MSREQPLTPVERRFGAQLKATTMGACLSARELVELAVQGRRCPDYEARMEHVVSCAACRQLLRELRAAETKRWSGLAPLTATPQRRLVMSGALVAAVCTLLLFTTLRYGQREVLALNDAGSRVALDATGHLTGLPDLPPAEREAVVQTLRTGRIEPPAILAALRAPAGTTDTTPAFAVNAPQTTVIESAKPEFTWQMPAGAVACRVLVTNLSNSADRIRTKPLTADHWRPKRSLTPGAIYRWQVIALDRAGRELARVPSHADGARFKVIATDEAARLADYRSRYGRSHLVMGTLYARQGLLDAAEQEFQALAQQNTRSDVARALLQSLRTLKTTT